MTKPDMSLLGWRVKDKLTGFTGIVQGFIQHYGGIIQADVQAIGKDATTIEQAYYIDLCQLEKQGKSPVLTDLPKHNALVAQLGDEVQDIASGFTGVVIEIKWFLNGCTKYCITGKVTEKSKPGDQVELYVFEARVKLIKALKPVEKPKAARTGGPTIPSTRF